MRSESSETPSPREWCMRTTTAEAASEVGKSRTWSSQSGREWSMGAVDSEDR